MAPPTSVSATFVLVVWKTLTVVSRASRPWKDARAVFRIVNAPPMRSSDISNMNNWDRYFWYSGEFSLDYIAARQISLNILVKFGSAVSYIPK